MDVDPADYDTGAWRLEALCRDVDPELFFPIGTTGVAVDHIEAAKSVCNACPVKKQCLEYALATNQESGVWGGTSEEERRDLRRAAIATITRSARSGTITASVAGSDVPPAQDRLEHP